MSTQKIKCAHRRFLALWAWVSSPAERGVTGFPWGLFWGYLAFAARLFARAPGTSGHDSMPSVNLIAFWACFGPAGLSLTSTRTRARCVAQTLFMEPLKTLLSARIARVRVLGAGTPKSSTVAACFLAVPCPRAPARTVPQALGYSL